MIPEIQWWSTSKSAYLTIGEMPTPHIVRALGVLNRGEYAPPGGLSVGEEQEVRAALEETLAARGFNVDGSPIDEVLGQ